MRVPLLLFGVLTATLVPARGSPIAATGVDIPVQQDFDEPRFYGKWYALALATTCHLIKQHKDSFTVGTLVVGPGRTVDEIHGTFTHSRLGFCSQLSGDYQKTGLPGKVIISNPNSEFRVEHYVVRTDYEGFAFLVMKEISIRRIITTAQLYGRSPDLRDNRLAEFRQFALDLGIPEDSIFTLINKGECVPQETGSKSKSLRRSVLEEEEGSAGGVWPTFAGKKEADCLKRMDPGPCLGMEIRYFYNTSAQACQGFVYGGCLGNSNNFGSERACLQTCRTEAACRLPVAPGGPCPSQFWAFDAQQGKCVTFTGCGSNANKFYLEKECNEYCGVLQEGDDEFLRLAPTQ